MRPVILFLLFLALPISAFAGPQKAETLTFEKVIDGATIVASGKTISLWGLKTPDPADPNSLAANLYLETMLRKGTLTCDEMSAEDGRYIMHCYSDGADIGSLMVQLGLATAADPYYQSEEQYARVQHRGVWHTRQGKPL